MDRAAFTIVVQPTLGEDRQPSSRARETSMTRGLGQPDRGQLWRPRRAWGRKSWAATLTYQEEQEIPDEQRFTAIVVPTLAQVDGENHLAMFGRLHTSHHRLAARARTGSTPT